MTSQETTVDPTVALDTDITVVEDRCETVGFFMCPPTYFDVEYSINPWMDPTVNVDKLLAQEQWQALIDGLRAKNHHVRLVDPAPGCPDMVFLGDAGIVRGNRFLCSNFRHEERKPEALHYASWFAEAGFEVTLPAADAIFEGYGDIVNFREFTVVGHGPRSNRAGIDTALGFADDFDLVLEVDLPDPRFYHLAAAIAILDYDTLVYFPDAFQTEDAAKIAKLVPNAIVATEADIYDHQACNVTPIGETVYMDGCSPAMRSDLERAGFGVEITPVGELKKGGGSVKCCLLPVLP